MNKEEQAQFDQLKADKEAAEKRAQEAEAKLAPSATGKPQKPADLHLYKGQYKELATGEVYGLRILEPSEARHGRTHTLKNDGFFWDGTEAEFRARFEKV